THDDDQHRRLRSGRDPDRPGSPRGVQAHGRRAAGADVRAGLARGASDYSRAPLAATRLPRSRSCPLWVNRVGKDCDTAAAHVRFAPKADNDGSAAHYLITACPAPDAATGLLVPLLPS